MKIQEVIDFLEEQGQWVNRSYTRDHVLFGDTQQSLENVVVCWVATLDVILQAIEKKCQLIITHENLFYMNATAIPTAILEAQKEKTDLLQKHHIVVYRCHDLWDLYPQIGVRDQWAKILGLEFQQPSHEKSFIRISYPFQMTVSALAKHIVQRIAPYHEYGVEVIGSLTQNVHCLGIGTGACTDVIEMYEQGADVCLVSDDGINNWIQTQWAMDHHIPLIVVNHLTSEAAGIKALKQYLSQQFTDIHFEYIANDYGIHHLAK